MPTIPIKKTGDEYIPADLFKELEDNGLELMTVLVKKIYVSGDWPKDFLDVMMIAKENQAKILLCNYNRTISVISHSSNIVLFIPNKRLKSRTEVVIEEYQFGFWKGKRTRYALDYWELC